MASIGPDIPAHLLGHSQPSRSTTPIAEEEDTEDSTSMGPALPPHLLNSSLSNAKESVLEEDEEEEDAYVPALPPNYSVSRPGPSSPPPPHTISERRTYGPSLPGHDRYNDDDDDDDYGPMPMPGGPRDEAGDGVREFMEREERRRKEVEEAAKPKALKRDEWMIVPPSSSDILHTLGDPTKLKARQFSRSTTATLRNAPNNLWTETPAERQQRMADEVSGKKRRAANANTEPDETDEMKKRRKVDEDIRRVVDGHTKSSRNKTLLDMHASTEKASSTHKPGRDDKDDAHGIWDHSRDMSMGGRLMDDKKRSQLINDAKGLGDRFGTGKAGGYL